MDVVRVGDVHVCSFAQRPGVKKVLTYRRPGSFPDVLNYFYANYVHTFFTSLFFFFFVRNVFYVLSVKIFRQQLLRPLIINRTFVNKQ